MFSYVELIADVSCTCACKLQMNDSDVYISYLPLAHIFDRVIEELFISHGASIGFWQGVRQLCFFFFFSFSFTKCSI